MELILGAMVMALAVKALPAALVDTVTMLRAAKAGEWGLIDKERARKHARSEGRRKAMSQAWSQVRARRHRKAGGDGNYRPGAKAYFGDIYHGFWEDALEKRTVRRAGRPPNRYDRAVQEKVGRQRQRSGMFGRVARALWEPVGDKRTTTPQPSAVDPWAGADEPTVEITPTADDNRGPDGSPMKEEPVTERLVDHVPGSPPDSPVDRTDATIKAEEGFHRLFERHPAVGDSGPRCNRCDTFSAQPGAELCHACKAAMNALGSAADEAWRNVDPDGSRGSEAGQEVVDQLQKRNTFGWTLSEMKQATKYARLRAASSTGLTSQVPTLSDQQRIRNELYGKCAHRTVREGFADEWCDNPYDGTGPYCRDHSRNDIDQTDNRSSNGGTTMTETAATEINTNEDARRAFETMRSAATEAADALAALEVARAKMAAAANGTADGMTAKAFDSAATTAAGEAAEAISVGTLADWSEKIDTVQSAAERGIAALDKYRDSEDVVASNNIDPTTLAATSS